MVLNKDRLYAYTRPYRVVVPFSHDTVLVILRLRFHDISYLALRPRRASSLRPTGYVDYSLSVGFLGSYQ